MIHDFAAVNGLKLHTVEAGSGKLMLFVHGFPEFWLAWRRQLEEFGVDHHAVAFDMRGFNLSDKPAAVEAYRAKHLVEDIRQLVAHLGHTSCILVAHDWGGAVAWNVAALHPGLVEKLVILNAPHPAVFARELAHSEAQRKASAYMLMFRSPEAEAILSADHYAALSKLFSRGADRPSAFAPDEQAAYLKAWAQPGALTGGLNYYRASPLHPPIDKPGPAIDPAAFRITVPTLVIWGMRDSALLPGLLDGLDAYVPDLRIERIADATHWVAHEYPAEVNALIRDFIAA